MSIDRKTIAQNYYGGTVDWKPVGIMSPDYKGYCIPYDNWPKELQKGYSSEKILNGHSSHFARWWIDQDLKKSLGR